MLSLTLEPGTHVCPVPEKTKGAWSRVYRVKIYALIWGLRAVVRKARPEVDLVGPSIAMPRPPVKTWPQYGRVYREHQAQVTPGYSRLKTRG